jgi:hypothetical protein
MAVRACVGERLAAEGAPPGIGRIFGGAMNTQHKKGSTQFKLLCMTFSIPEKPDFELLDCK